MSVDRRQSPKKQSAKTLREQRRQAVASLVLAGQRYVDIVETLRARLHPETGAPLYPQLSVSTIGNDVKAIRAQLREEQSASMAEHQAIAGARLDALLAEVWPAAMAGKLAAIDRVLAILRQHAALYGYNAPARHELSGPDGGPIEIDSQQVTVAIVGDITRLTDGDLGELRRILALTTPGLEADNLLPPGDERRETLGES